MNTGHERDFKIGDQVHYRNATATGMYPDAPAQPEESGPYSARIVECGQVGYFVRSDGFQGQAPLYYVHQLAIIAESEGN